MYTAITTSEQKKPIHGLLNLMKSLSDPFIVEPAELSVSINDTNDGLLVSLLGPDWGYRLIDIDGSAIGHKSPHGSGSHPYFYRWNDTNTYRCNFV